MRHQAARWSHQESERSNLPSGHSRSVFRKFYLISKTVSLLMIFDDQFANPKMHDPIRFSEVTCDKYEVPLTSGISPNVQA